LSTRLLLAQGIVLLACTLTAALVAALVGPLVFHQHLADAGQATDSNEQWHIEVAYREAAALALGVALVISLACALAVTWYLSRRLASPLAALTESASAMSAGDYQTRVPTTGAGAELDALAAAFNAMAAELETTEDTRRRLLADLAHEMLTPVATIAAYLEGLDDGLATWNPATSAVLHDQSHRLARLAHDIDDVSRAEERRITLDLVAVPVEDLVLAALAVARQAYGQKGVHLVGAPSAESDAQVRVDRARLGQVFTNLLDNALRHTPAGGSVTVQAAREAGRVTVRVDDTGEGIPAGQLGHVFERFYRGDTARDRNRGGSGIGLTISRAIVEAHGGTLTAQSDGPGTGATFTITLPDHPS
jgi:signal transduction histidine kinase